MARNYARKLGSGKRMEKIRKMAKKNSVRRGGSGGSGRGKGGGKGRDKSWSSGDHFERKESQLAHQDKQRL